MTQPLNQKHRRGAPLGNQNAHKHGLRSAAAIEKRRRRNAMLKACALVLSRMGMVDGRCRCRPIRPDQWEYLPPEWQVLLRGSRIKAPSIY